MLEFDTENLPNGLTTPFRIALSFVARKSKDCGKSGIILVSFDEKRKVFVVSTTTENRPEKVFSTSQHALKDICSLVGVDYDAPLLFSNAHHPA